MANIQPQVDAIRQAVWGEDVRESIASGLEAMNTESSEAIAKAVTAQDSATNSAIQAAQSATDADSSANVAKAAETGAQATIPIIEGLKNDAQQALADTKLSEAAAKQAETNAKQAETNAKQAESNALIYQNNASTSANQAAQSATDAYTSNTQAQQAAVNAQTSATTAGNAQTSAAISATNAANSEQAAQQYAQQAQAAANVQIATTTTAGIVKPDGTTISVDQYGRISAKGTEDHAQKSLVSTEQVHGVRVYTDPTSLFTSLQKWNETDQSWKDMIRSLKPDGTTITMDPDGTIHGSSTVDIDAELSTTSENPVQNKVITSKINTNQALITDEWINKGYSKGEIKIHNNKLWECIQDHNIGIEPGVAPESANYWTEKSVGNLIKQINSDLTDKSLIEWAGDCQGSNATLKKLLEDFARKKPVDHTYYCKIADSIGTSIMDGCTGIYQVNKSDGLYYTILGFVYSSEGVILFGASMVNDSLSSITKFNFPHVDYLNNNDVRQYNARPGSMIYADIRNTDGTHIKFGAMIDSNGECNPIYGNKPDTLSLTFKNTGLDFYLEIKSTYNGVTVVRFEY